MKTYFLIIGISVVLTLGVVCIVSYRMSKPDSAAKQKSAHQVQKQKVEKVIINKTPSTASVKTMPGPVSATARADKKSAAQNPNRKSLIANKQTKSPLERFEGKRIANAQEIPERILNQQSQSKPLSNAEIAAGPAGVEGSDIKVWTQGQDTGNFSSITGNKAFTVPPRKKTPDPFLGDWELF
jgi:hypothetical protein